MGVHDWRKVYEGDWHSFYVGWLASLSGALNRGILPSGYYAQTAFKHSISPPGESAVAMEERRPFESAIEEAEHRFYRRKQRYIAIRRVADEGLIAAIDVVSPWNTEMEIFSDNLESIPVLRVDVAAVEKGTPLFDIRLPLDGDHGVELPLSETYDYAWQGVPKHQREFLSC